MMELANDLLDVMGEHHLFAFICGFHKRLGRDSLLCELDEAVQARIIELGFHVIAPTKAADGSVP